VRQKLKYVAYYFDTTARQAFLKALVKTYQRFEGAHGEIKDYEQPPIPLNFGPTGEA
jgi:hypothetical protein